MKLGMDVGLGSGHIVLDGNPAAPPKRGTAPNFLPMSVVSNGWMHEDTTWYGAIVAKRLDGSRCRLVGR